MCGISGLFRFNHNANPLDLATVQKMSDCMAHRGPDAEGLFQHSNCILGHRRLSIIDVDKRSNQPFTDHLGRYVLVFNGQIYNYKDIKAELPDYPCITTSDTEVIVAAYAKWGAACLEKMKGMFALAIYDTLERVLFLARDRFGIKPLYYYLDSSVFLFASEMRALYGSISGNSWHYPIGSEKISE